MKDTTATNSKDNHPQAPASDMEPSAAPAPGADVGQGAPQAAGPSGESGESPAPVSDAMLREQMASVIREYLRLDKELQLVENTNFRVCIFGSARIRRRDRTWQTVYMLAKQLAQMGIDIVTGGGPGLMEAANRAVRDAHDERAKAYGLPLDIPSLKEPENKHLDIKSAHQRFSTRLDEFMRLSHAVIVAPGGIGTLLELMYVWQLIQIGLLEPRPVLLLGDDFWQGFLDWMRATMEERGFIDPEDMHFVRVVSTREEVVQIIGAEQEKFLQQLEKAHAGQPARPVTVTVGQPAPVGPAAMGQPAPVVPPPMLPASNTGSNGSNPVKG